MINCSSLLKCNSDFCITFLHKGKEINIRRCLSLFEMALSSVTVTGLGDLELHRVWLGVQMRGAAVPPGAGRVICRIAQSNGYSVLIVRINNILWSTISFIWFRTEIHNDSSSSLWSCDSDSSVLHDLFHVISINSMSSLSWVYMSNEKKMLSTSPDLQIWTNSVIRCHGVGYSWL